MVKVALAVAPVARLPTKLFVTDVGIGELRFPIRLKSALDSSVDTVLAKAGKVEVLILFTCPKLFRNAILAAA